MAIASFTDAWIETIRSLDGHKKCDIASFTDAWIETMITIRGNLY